VEAERISDGDFRVTAGPFNITVAYVVGHRAVGIMNVDDMGSLLAASWPEGRWWFARANIGDVSLRGKGIGTRMLNLVKTELQKRDSFREVLVAPGGYGSDEKKRRNFYVKNGFEPVSEGALLWRPQS